MMAFGFLGDIVEEIGEVILPRGTRGETIGGLVGLPQTGKVVSQALSQASGKSAVSTPTASQAPGAAAETQLSSVSNAPISQQDYYNMARGREIITGGFQPRLPGPIGTGVGVGTAVGTAMDIIPDINISKFFGDSACMKKMPKLVGMTKDGCPTVTRKQQRVLRQMAQYMPLESVAYEAGVDTTTMARLISKSFPPRSKGISGAQLRTANRVNNKILSMAGKLGYNVTPKTKAQLGCK